MTNMKTYISNVIDNGIDEYLDKLNTRPETLVSLRNGVAGKISLPPLKYGLEKDWLV